MSQKVWKSLSVRHILVLPCEGDAEENMLGYFNKNLNKNKSIHIYNIGGLSSLTDFKKKYNKLMKEYSIKPKDKYFTFTFLFNNDLEETDSIVKFLTQQQLKYILLNPNIEGFLLELFGKKTIYKDKNKYSRQKCKDVFITEFGLAAHRLKGSDWDKIFGQDCSKINTLIKENSTLKEIIEIIL